MSCKPFLHAPARYRGEIPPKSTRIWESLPSDDPFAEQAREHHERMMQLDPAPGIEAEGDRT